MHVVRSTVRGRASGSQASPSLYYPYSSHSSGVVPYLYSRSSSMVAVGYGEALDRKLSGNYPIKIHVNGCFHVKTPIICY